MTQLTIFDCKPNYQPRFQAYLDYSGKSHPSELEHFEFRVWVSEHHEVFKRQNNVRKTQPLTNRQHEEFTDYLKEVAINDSQVDD